MFYKKTKHTLVEAVTAIQGTASTNFCKKLSISPTDLSSLSVANNSITTYKRV